MNPRNSRTARRSARTLGLRGEEAVVATVAGRAHKDAQRRRLDDPGSRLPGGVGSRAMLNRPRGGLMLSLAAAPLTYLQAIVIGIVQGITELFPISSLGHSVLLPELLGWDKLVTGQSADESFYLAFLVGLHVATAIALLIFFWRDWKEVIKGFFSSLRKRRIETPPERMAWLLIVGTIPVGIVGLAFEHNLRTIFAKPTAAAIFLTINGLILFAGERLRRRAEVRKLVTTHEHHNDPGNDVGRDLDTLELHEGVFVGLVADPCALRRHQPLRRHHGRRSAPRSRPRRRDAILPSR